MVSGLTDPPSPFDHSCAAALIWGVGGFDELRGFGCRVCGAPRMPVSGGLGITKSSKPCPRDSKITTKTKSLHFEDSFLQLTLPPNQSTKSEAWSCTVVVQ